MHAILVELLIRTAWIRVTYLARIFPAQLEASTHGGVDDDEVLLFPLVPLLTFFVVHDGYVDFLKGISPVTTL